MIQTMIDTNQKYDNNHIYIDIHHILKLQLHAEWYALFTTTYSLNRIITSHPLAGKIFI